MPESPKSDFIREIIAGDLASGKHETTVTRFPPEPNGYLHLGHARAICLNFGIAAENAASGARCHLRFDDTNPEKEEAEYVESIKEDVRWLGFDWGEHLYFASDYFRVLLRLRGGADRPGGWPTSTSRRRNRSGRTAATSRFPGRTSPWRDRPVDENRELFARMRAGDFKDGEVVLRARIDMASPNMVMRDPVIYRVHAPGAPQHRRPVVHLPDV